MRRQCESVSEKGNPPGSGTRGAQRRGGLGRGLEALIPNLGSAIPEGSISQLSVASIAPNPRQPRGRIDSADLEALADSIRIHGLLQPVLVRPALTPGSYTLIAGERRWRAAQLAGMDAIPAVVMDVSLQAQLELALVENVVRSDLSALEEAVAYRQLIDDFGLTQAEVADRVGRSRVTVTNTLRLLLLPDRVKESLEDGDITEGHARALLGLPSATEQIAMLESVVRRQLSVRETEAAVRRWIEREHTPSARGSLAQESGFSEAEQRLRRALATNVSIAQSSRGSGSIRIDFGSAEQLTELLDRITGEPLY